MFTTSSKPATLLEVDNFSGVPLCTLESSFNAADFCGVGMCTSGTIFIGADFCGVGPCFVFSNEEYNSCKKVDQILQGIGTCI